MADNSEEKTLEYYNKHAWDWGEHHHELGNTRRIDELEKFRKLIPSGRIIEIGSGTGSDAKFFREHGYDYIGTDASRGLMKVAQERNPGVMFKNVRVQDLSPMFSEDEFDGFWCAAILLHLHKNELDAALKNIHTIVRDGGLGFISVKQGEGEAVDDTGRLFSYYSQTEFSKILKRNGFKVLEKEIEVWNRLNRRPFDTVFVRNYNLFVITMILANIFCHFLVSVMPKVGIILRKI